MSDSNVETIRKGIEGVPSAGFDTALDALRDDVTWERFLSRTESADRVVRRTEELRAVWESQVDAVDLRGERPTRSD